MNRIPNVNISPAERIRARLALNISAADLGGAASLDKRVDAVIVRTVEDLLRDTRWVGADTDWTAAAHTEVIDALAGALTDEVYAAFTELVEL